MTKTICDICKREIPTSIYSSQISEVQFSIKYNGRYLDVCDKCKKDFSEWMNKRAKEAADGQD